MTFKRADAKEGWTVRDGKRLRTHRKILGLSQIAFGERLGLSQMMLSRLENGMPPAKHVAAIMKLYLKHRGAETDAKREAAWRRQRAAVTD